MHEICALFGGGVQSTCDFVEVGPSLPRFLNIDEIAPPFLRTFSGMTLSGKGNSTVRSSVPLESSQSGFQFVFPAFLRLHWNALLPALLVDSVSRPSGCSIVSPAIISIRPSILNSLIYPSA